MGLKKSKKHTEREFSSAEFSYWHQFIQLFLGQLTDLNSIQDIFLCLKAHNSKPSIWISRIMLSPTIYNVYCIRPLVLF